MIIVLMGGCCRNEYETETSSVSYDIPMLLNEQTKGIPLVDVCDSNYIYSIAADYLGVVAPKTYDKLLCIINGEDKKAKPQTVDIDWNY